MKLKKVLFITLFATTSISFAQLSKDVSETKYRRSSLHTILIESENFPKKENVINAYNNAPFPDKYDNHTIGEKSLDLSKLMSTDNLKDENIVTAINQYFKDNKIANKLVAKWFNRKENGSFDIELIGERGLINASFTDIKTAEASAEGKALLKTAGLDLIGNTFVVVSKMKFLENEPVARAARDLALKSAENMKMELLRAGAIEAANLAYEKGKEGYSVWTTSFLYKLKWDDVTSNTFYQDLWINPSDTGTEEKKSKFDTSDLFQLEYVGSENSSSLVTFSLSQKRTEDEIINLSVTRNIDNVYAKLQKKYDVFKTKTPLFTGNPISAKIGLKEGLEGGEKFEVLEATMDPKTGIVEYKKKGVIKVDKKAIWDNRYKADPTSEGTTNTVNATSFSGGDKFYPGMLIRQIN
jgi:hypothetical protein